MNSYKWGNKEFTLTPEEEELCENKATWEAMEEKEIILECPNSLEELIEGLKAAREQILWDVEDIDLCDVSWRPYAMPVPYEDYTYDTIIVSWSKPRNSKKEYEKFSWEMLKEKRRRYEDYLVLKKEFEE